MGSSINKKQEPDSIADDFEKKKKMIEEWNKNEQKRNQLNKLQTEVVDKKEEQKNEKQQQYIHSQSLPPQNPKSQTMDLYQSFPSIVGSGGIEGQKKIQEEDSEIFNSEIVKSTKRDQNNPQNQPPPKQPDIVQSPPKKESEKQIIIQQDSETQIKFQSETNFPTGKFRPSITSEMHESIYRDNDNKNQLQNPLIDQLDNGKQIHESEVIQNTSKFVQTENSLIQQQQIQNPQKQQEIQNPQNQQPIQTPQNQQQIQTPQNQQQIQIPQNQQENMKPQNQFSFSRQDVDVNNSQKRNQEMYGTQKPGTSPLLQSQAQDFGSVLIGESPILLKLPYSNLNQLQMFAELPEWTQKMLTLYQLYEPKEKKQDEGCKIEKIKQQGVLYEGQMQNGKKNGYGMFFKNNEFYEGYFTDDERQGWGRLLSQNGELKSGYWEKNFIQKEMYFRTNNMTYEGQCRNSCPHGKGKLIREGEFTYEGNFSEGKLNGRGIRKNLKDNTQYEGEFYCDIIQGQGTYKFSNGKKYSGQFENNKFQGKGEMFWPDGRYYKGQFHKNFRHGQGYQREADGSTYEGGWIEDKKNGMGKQILNGIEIHGVWKNDEYQEE